MAKIRIFAPDNVAVLECESAEGRKAGNRRTHVPLSKSLAALAARVRRITRKNHGQEITAKIPR
jgi:hypothetical protein